IATAFVQNGVRVYITARRLEDAQPAANELTEMGPGSCVALQSNLMTREHAEKLAAVIMQREERVHILVNKLHFNETKSWDTLMAVSVKFGFYLAVAYVSASLLYPFYEPLLNSCAAARLLPALSAGANNVDPGRVINISSVAAHTYDAEYTQNRPGWGTWPYAASKAAVNHLTRTLAVSLARHSITVNAIAPGLFPSKMAK
ncbi:hypothetical protein HK101_011456, partial [Irineochytrium annulatum]